MDFFDDVLNKTRDALDVAYKKTEQAVMTGKQKMDISSMRSAITKRYEALGREIISEIEDSNELPKNIEAIVKDIRKREEILRLAESELGKATCSLCGAKNTTSAKFCTNCGAQML